MKGAGIEISGYNEATRAVGIIAQKLEHRTPLWKAVGDEIAQQTAERFETSTGPDGQVWPPSWRVREHGGKTLLLSGLLRKSITVNAHEDGGEVGSPLMIALVHQHGATIKAKTEKGLHWNYQTKGANAASHARKMEVTIPARPFMGTNAEDEAGILDEAERYLREENYLLKGQIP